MLPARFDHKRRLPQNLWRTGREPPRGSGRHRQRRRRGLWAARRPPPGCQESATEQEFAVSGKCCFGLSPKSELRETDQISGQIPLQTSGPFSLTPLIDTMSHEGSLLRWPPTRAQRMKSSIRVRAPRFDHIWVGFGQTWTGVDRFTTDAGQVPSWESSAKLELEIKADFDHD